MNIDLVIAISVIGMSGLILHFKSHVKFVALGVFIGLALLEIIPLSEYFASSGAESLAKIFLLVTPALILGVNHTVDKRKNNILWTTIFVLVFTLFFLSSIAQLLPPQYESMVIEQSLIAWQALDYYPYYTLAAAVLVLIDSIKHRHYIEKEKKKKKAKSKKGKKRKSTSSSD